MVHPQLNALQRIEFLRVPVDIIPEESLESAILELESRNESHKIVFLSYKDMMRARRDQEYLSFLKKASLIVPVSKSIERGMKFLHKPLPFRYHPFDFVIRVLGILEKKRKSIYLLGGRHQSIQTVASNLRASFPSLPQVGRHTGFFPKETQETILTAIQKASPSVLFLGPGIQGKDKWAFRHQKQLTANLVFWSQMSFDIMSGKKLRPTKESFKKGTHELGGVLRNPLKILRVFSYFWYSVLLIFYKFTNR